MGKALGLTLLLWDVKFLFQLLLAPHSPETPKEKWLLRLCLFSLPGFPVWVVNGSRVLGDKSHTVSVILSTNVLCVRGHSGLNWGPVYRARIHPLSSTLSPYPFTLLFFNAVLEIKPTALCMLGKHSHWTAPQPFLCLRQGFSALPRLPLNLFCSLHST